MANINPSIESWKITNISSISITIIDIPSLPTIKPNQTIEALNYTTAGSLNNSVNFRNYLKNGILTSSNYLHTHNHNDTQQIQGGITDQYYHLGSTEHIRITDFFKNTDITSEEAETLTDGSNADKLHSHIQITVSIYKAYCKENAPDGTIIRASLGSLEGEEINVYCTIVGQNSVEEEKLSNAVPPLETGDPIDVYFDGEKWNCTTLFTLTTTIINLSDLNNVEISNPQNGQSLKYNAFTGKWTNQD